MGVACTEMLDACLSSADQVTDFTIDCGGGAMLSQSYTTSKKAAAR